MKTIAHLYIGTNKKNVEDMKNGKFNDLVFASDSMETFAHYYDGAVALITVELDHDMVMDRLTSSIDLAFHKNYTWGSNEMICPKRTNWYSFSAMYLRSHIKEVVELPDEIVKPIVDYYNKKE